MKTNTSCRVCLAPVDIAKSGFVIIDDWPKDEPRDEKRYHWDCYKSGTVQVVAAPVMGV